MVEDAGTEPRPISASIDFHNRRGIALSASILTCQNVSFFLDAVEYDTHDAQHTTPQ